MTILTKGISLAILVSLLAIFMTADIFKESRENIFRITRSYVDKPQDQKSNPPNENKYMTYDVVSKKGDTLFTKDRIAKFDGSDGSPGLYLAILGRVYDVKAGEKHYGADGGYGFFRGSLRVVY